MRSSPLIESLENRQLMSISAATIVGPLTKGATLTYNLYNSGALVQNYVEKIGGVVSVGGLNCNEIDESQTFPAQHETLLTKEYFHLGSKGFILYKSFNDIKNQTAEETKTITYTTPLPQLPATLTAKHTDTFAFADKIVIVDNPGNTTQTVHDSGSFSIELASEKTSKLKTAGGTFDVYTVYTSNKLTENGKSTTTKSTLYYAAGYGMVETDIGTESIQLLKYKKAPKASSAIAITASSIFSSSSVKKDCLVSDVME